MTGGIVTGGWEFVWAAYGITFLVVGGYAVSLAARLGRGSKKEEGR
jgi:heme exporter protein D